MNNMLTIFIKMLILKNRKMKMKIEEETIMSMIYTLETLSYRGLTIRGTVRKNLNWLKKWYKQESESEYLELALLQICALLRMGLVKEEDIVLYREICALADTSMENLMENCASMAKPVKVSRQSIYSLIGKWMPSKKNPMKQSDVVEAIMDKLINRREGQWYYYYEKSQSGNSYPETVKKGIYKLVINREESFFLDLKQFRIYTFKW